MSDYTTHVYDENAVLRQRIAELEQDNASLHEQNTLVNAKCAELEAQVEKGRNIVRNDMHRAGQYQARIDALEAALQKVAAVLRVDDEYSLYDTVCDALK